MVFRVVTTAKPPDFQRLRVIAMMGLRLSTANLAGLTGKAAISYRIVYALNGANSVRMCIRIGSASFTENFWAPSLMLRYGFPAIAAGIVPPMVELQKAVTVERSMNTNIPLRALFALAEAPVTHSWVTVELSKCFRLSAFEAAFHA